MLGKRKCYFSKCIEKNVQNINIFELKIKKGNLFENKVFLINYIQTIL